MAIVSKPCHRKLYVRRKGYEAGFVDVESLVCSVLHLEIATPLKKRMLVHALWEIVKLNGDFRTRFRSKAALTLGVVIERDHVYQKGRVIKCLMDNPDQTASILNKSLHCVVTKEEHRKLTQLSEARAEIDGWSRYHEAGIEVLDMCTGNPYALTLCAGECVVPDDFDAPLPDSILQAAERA